MPANRDSLLGGRNADPLNEHSVRSAMSAFLGLDADAPVKHDPGARTQFRVTIEDGIEVAEIVFGPDIYPGRGIDANSSMSLRAAAAHELVHWQRWVDRREIESLDLTEIDEALTSLEATHRFAGQLSDHDVRLLVGDAIQRLQMYARRQGR
jgi:hypothetical protein